MAFSARACLSLALSASTPEVIDSGVGSIEDVDRCMRCIDCDRNEGSELSEARTEGDWVSGDATTLPDWLGDCKECRTQLIVGVFESERDRGLPLYDALDLY